jgi:hypothetical protein
MRQYFVCGLRQHFGPHFAIWPIEIAFVAESHKAPAVRFEQILEGRNGRLANSQIDLRKSAGGRKKRKPFCYRIPNP